MTVAAAAVPGQDQLCVQSKQRHIDIAGLRELAAAMAQDLGFLGAGFVVFINLHGCGLGFSMPGQMYILMQHAPALRLSSQPICCQSGARQKP